MNYYNQKLYIAHVNRTDEVLDGIERWEAHEKGILHRAFSLAIFYNDQVILQQRKHPAFDSYFDITISSHQFYENGKVEDDFDAMYRTLKREMNLFAEDLVASPIFKGKFYYQAENPYDKRLQEHEINYVYKCTTKKLPQPNYEYCYGIIQAPLAEIKTSKNLVTKILTPWTIEAFNNKLL